jgi:hypothetical protein
VFLVLSVLFLAQHKRKKKVFKLSACTRRGVRLNMWVVGCVPAIYGEMMAGVSF